VRFFRPSVDVVGEILPGTGDAGTLALAAETGLRVPTSRANALPPCRRNRLELGPPMCSSFLQLRISPRTGRRLILAATRGPPPAICRSRTPAMLRDLRAVRCRPIEFDGVGQVLFQVPARRRVHPWAWGPAGAAWARRGVVGPDLSGAHAPFLEPSPAKRPIEAGSTRCSAGFLH